MSLTRRHLITALPGAALLTAAGCTFKVPLTHPMRDAYDLDPEPAADPQVDPEGATEPDQDGPRLDDLQYFVSERVVLRRRIRSGEAKVARGKVISRKGKLLEEVIVRRTTPGIAVEIEPDAIAVSFEEGTRLWFDLAARGPDYDPDDITKNTYRLRLVEDEEGRRLVDFDGKLYRPVNLTTQARLLIKRTSLYRYKRSRRVLRGVRVKKRE